MKVIANNLSITEAVNLLQGNLGKRYAISDVSLIGFSYYPNLEYDLVDVTISNSGHVSYSNESHKFTALEILRSCFSVYEDEI